MSEPTKPAVVIDFDTNGTHVSAPTASQLTDGFLLNEVPKSSLFNFIWSGTAQLVDWVIAKLALFPGYAPDTTVTISAGNAITPTAGNHIVDTIGGAAPTSDLANILTTNLDDGRMLVLNAANAGRVPVIKHAAGGAGQIHLNDGLDFSLATIGTVLTLKRIGADWYEVARSIQAAAEVPGVVKAYAGIAAPAGYLLCDGAAVSRSTYASLFSVAGTRYGNGDGVTTFNVPNLKGRFIRGLADYADTTCRGLPGSNTATFTGHPYRQTGARVRLTGGSMVGLVTDTDYYVIYVDANTLAFATTLANAVAGTKISISANSSAQISQWEDPNAASRASSTVGSASGAVAGSLQVDGFKSHGHTLQATTGSVTVAGGSGAGNIGNNPGTVSSDAMGGDETRPLNVAMNYIIKF